MEQAFCYYSQMAPTGYSVTMRLDVTRTRAALRNRGLKFFPAYVYLATRAVGARPELRVALQDGVLGRWEQLSRLSLPAPGERHDLAALERVSPGFRDVLPRHGGGQSAVRRGWGREAALPEPTPALSPRQSVLGTA